MRDPCSLREVVEFAGVIKAGVASTMRGPCSLRDRPMARVVVFGFICFNDAGALLPSRHVRWGRHGKRYIRALQRCGSLTPFAMA